jgi:hypothetical protein
VKSETAVASAKLSPPVVVSVLQQITEGLPTFILWATAIYTVLQMYVLIRDKIVRKKCDG